MCESQKRSAHAETSVADGQMHTALLDALPVKNGARKRSISHRLLNPSTISGSSTALGEEVGSPLAPSLAQDDTTDMKQKTHSLLVFSGGTAANALCQELQGITEDIAYVLPISDNGGSTYEITRVLGGPAIGDIRSRLVRLADESTDESRAVKDLLQHRLPVDQGEEIIKLEWLRLVEGSHPLWRNISEPFKESIRAFLVYFNTQILRTAGRHFNLRNGSVGNFFFTGARMFFNSLEAAIFWFSGIAGIPARTEVMPIINKNQAMTLGAELANGERIIGQNEISHPQPRCVLPAIAGANSFIENRSVTTVHKLAAYDPFSAPIRRVFYVNSDNNEIKPPLNERVLETLARKNAIIYAMGSLYTSLIPCLIFSPLAKAIASLRGPKILLLNGYADRETHGLSGVDYVKAVVAALNDTLPADDQQPGERYITHVLRVKEGEIPLSEDDLRYEVGAICVVDVDSHDSHIDNGRPLFAQQSLLAAIESIVR